MKFELIAGTHHAGTKVLEKGDTIESASDLTLIFPNKFKKVNKRESEVEEEVTTTEPESTVPPVDEVDEVDKGDEGDKKLLEGEDITDQYDIAVDNNIKVMKQGSWYSLYDMEEGGQMIGDNKVRKTKITEAIKNYLK